MTKRIALVRVAALVDGKTQEFLPGSELPELSPQDAEELLRTGSIEDAPRTAGDTKKK